MKNLIKLIVGFLIVTIFLLIISGLLIYPHYHTIQLTINSLNIHDISRNTTLKIFIKLAHPANEDITTQDSSIDQIEQINPTALAKYQNQGNIITYLEPMNTELIIPRVNIQGRIFDGETAKTLSKGIWHFPLSVTPGEKGNSVFIGHRYAKIPPATDTFFNLDKIEIGDKIIIKQKNQVMNFTVTQIKIVEKNDRSILAQSNDYRITLITCTPLWTDKQRLVVTAKLDKVYRNI